MRLGDLAADLRAHGLDYDEYQILVPAPAALDMAGVIERGLSAHDERAALNQSWANLRAAHAEAEAVLDRATDRLRTARRDGAIVLIISLFTAALVVTEFLSL